MPIRETARTESTQDDLLRLLQAEGAAWPHLSGLRAERQLAGRGRTGRSWDTRGVRALTVSYVLRPAAPMSEWSTIALRAGSAVVEALAEFDLTAQVKWPNDIVVPSTNNSSGWHGIAKVGGILGTVGTDVDGKAVCVLGVGINLQGQPSAPGAESLESDLSAAVLAQGIARHLGEAIPEGAQRFPALAPLVARHCHTIGRAVAVAPAAGAGAEEIRGIATRVDPDGALVVDTPEGERRILTGDVAHTRLQAPLG